MEKRVAVDEFTLDDTWLNANDAPNKGDEALFVRFYKHPHQDEKATAEAGRPIFVDVEYVSIAASGDKFNVVVRPATKKDKARFRRQYKMFQENASESTVGTPLTRWPLIQAAQVEELKYFNVRTVEQLASMPDGNIPNVGNISKLKKQAQDFLEFAKGQAPAVQLRNELEKRDTEIAALRAQMQEIVAAQRQAAAPVASEALTEAPRRRGRPPRQPDEGASAE